MTGSLHAHIVSGTQLRATIESDQGATLSLTGDFHDVEPQIESASVDTLHTNIALHHNMWSFAKTWYVAHTLSPTDALSISDPATQKAALSLVVESRKAAKKHSAEFAKTAQWIADVADDLSQLDVLEAWCSACFSRSAHRKSNRPAGQLPVYVCQACGSPTLGCIAPACSNMAVRDRGSIRIPQFCAEHRRDIPGFEKAQGTFGELFDYEHYLEYEKPDFNKASKIAALGAVAVGLTVPLALAAAPAIGGAIGSLGMFGGLSGAAATSHGLAILGGGSLAAGGLGMAGGTAVVTAVGAAVGGALGASVANAYLCEDKSFRIELLRPGSGGVPVLVANGFLTDTQGDKWGGWRELVTERYPDSPVYRVFWGAKELRDFGLFGANAAGKAGGTAATKAAAATATKAGAKVLGNIVGPAMIASDLAKNPWHVAKSRADKTGVILGDLLARTEAKSYVLIGHSLGARAMLVAAQTLGSKPGAPRVEAAHLLGAAVGARGDWESLAQAIDEAVYCYYSSADSVLKYVYRTAQAGEAAAGCVGFSPASSKLQNIDVTAQVKSHSEYLSNVRLA